MDAGRIKNMRSAKHRFESAQKPMGRVLIWLDAVIATAISILGPAAAIRIVAVCRMATGVATSPGSGQSTELGARGRRGRGRRGGRPSLSGLRIYRERKNTDKQGRCAHEFLTWINEERALLGQICQRPTPGALGEPSHVLCV